MLKAVTGWLPGLAGRAASYAFDKPYLDTLKRVVDNYHEIMRDENKHRQSKSSANGVLDAQLDNIEQDILVVRALLGLVDKKEEDVSVGGDSNYLGQIKEAVKSSAERGLRIKEGTEAEWFIRKYELLLSLYNTWFQWNHYWRIHLENREEGDTGTGMTGGGGGATSPPRTVQSTIPPSAPSRRSGGGKGSRYTHSFIF